MLGISVMQGFPPRGIDLRSYLITEFGKVHGSDKVLQVVHCPQSPYFLPWYKGT